MLHANTFSRTIKTIQRKNSKELPSYPEPRIGYDHVHAMECGIA